jgi:ribosomal protein S18 acetylase RimI-like enzyme
VNERQSLQIVHADDAEHVEVIRALFREYAESLGFSLCFQNFDEELAQLPGKYSRPRGRLLLARVGDEHAGCVGVQPFLSDICEMKRLYVRPAFRGAGIGRALAEAAICETTEAHYAAIRLDTIEPLMGAAVRMYRTLGFYDIEPYRPNPIAGALYMELRPSSPPGRALSALRNVP